MTRSVFDAAVVGLGAMGSAALWQLSRRGLRTIGIDRHAPPHHLGSSHGLSRIIRAAYHEHPLYVPLVRRAAELWHDLSAAVREPLLTRTGALIAGPADGVLVAGAALSARTHDLPHARWTAAQVGERLPAFRMPDGFEAVWEPGAGVLAPERCVHAMLAEARRCGAEILTDTPVVGWTRAGGRVTIATAAHDYEARAVILAAGPWMPEILTDLPLPLSRERMVQCWFTPAGDAAQFAPDRFPVFLVEYEPGRMFYGVPDAGDGVKAAFHHQGERASMTDIRRHVADHETVALHRVLASWLPDAAGPLREATVCVYTNTPDQHFVLDRHPGVPEAIVVSCCSGHGFKFASAIGEIAADLAIGRVPAFDLAPFSIGRFGLGTR